MGGRLVSVVWLTIVLSASQESAHGLECISLKIHSLQSCKGLVHCCHWSEVNVTVWYSLFFSVCFFYDAVIYCGISTESQYRELLQGNSTITTHDWCFLCGPRWYLTSCNNRGIVGSSVLCLSVEGLYVENWNTSQSWVVSTVSSWETEPLETTTESHPY
jgi:hypothetical protein